MNRISICWPVAYDWERAVPELARLWGHADEHLVAWDRRGRTWAGERFTAPSVSSFTMALAREGIAPHQQSPGRVRFFPGDYWTPASRHRRENQDGERRALMQLARPGGWIVMHDADESWCNAEEAAWWLRQHPPVPAGGVTMEMRTVFKVIGETALVFPDFQTYAYGSPGALVRSRAAHAVGESPLRAVNDSFYGAGSEVLTLKLGSVLYTEGFDHGALVDKWHRLSLENYQAPEYETFADLCTKPLRAIGLSDLYAGRWEGAR